MIKTINGKEYNTDAAWALWCKNRGKYNNVHDQETTILYKDKDSYEYFLCRLAYDKTEIRPISKDEAKVLLEKDGYVESARVYE